MRLHIRHLAGVERPLLVLHPLQCLAQIGNQVVDVLDAHRIAYQVVFQPCSLTLTAIQGEQRDGLLDDALHPTERRTYVRHT
jgi:hypothetical protein